jgi:superfamily II DNA or RNA helicase
VSRAEICHQLYDKFPFARRIRGGANSFGVWRFGVWNFAVLRLILPPNLDAAIPRDAIIVQVALAVPAGPALPADLLPGLAILQRLGVKPGPASIAQLTRAQLRELIAALAGQPVFFHGNVPDVPIAWHGRDLSGVSEQLTKETGPIRPMRPMGSITKPPAPRPKPGPPPPTATPLLIDGSEHFLAVTLPSREAAHYDEILEFLRAQRFVLDPLSRKWWLRDRHRVLNLLATHGRLLREDFGAEFTENFQRNTARLREAEAAAEVTESADGYEVSLGLRAGQATDAQLREAVATGRGYVEDANGIYLIDRERLERVQAAHRRLAGDPGEAGTAVRRHRIAKARAAEVNDLLEELAPHFQAPETWRRRSAALRQLTSLPPAPVPPALDAILRPYQRLGVAWLWHLRNQELGGILADEMGLGKTLQALALLAAARSHSPVGASSLATRDSREQARSHAAASKADRTFAPVSRSENRGQTPAGEHAGTVHLVVCPASLVENWRREAARFTPELKVFVHHGARRLAGRDFAAHDLVLTSYGTLARDSVLFESVEFGLILADEAQHLKNRRTQAAQSLRALRGRGRFLLTGTPLENSLDDLRSLFEFLMPGFPAKVPPGLKRDERAWHDEQLRTQTAPYILRRTKAAVAPELPEKIEQTIYCEPTTAQSALYRRWQEDGERELMDLAAKGSSEASLRFAVFTQLLRLRQICCDPRLIPGGNPLARDVGASSLATPNPGKPGAARSPTDAPLYPDSAKLEAFRELLAESIDEGHRMLVFSQFTSLLGLLREELEAQGVAFCYLDGSLTPKARQAAVDKFQQDASIPVFLISLKAGGTGLNLTGADVVVHFDPWWNPAAEAQATDRAHRIGQTKVVTSYKLICSGTVEEKVLALQDTKRALLADVFEASDAAAAKLSLADLRDLLK